MTSDLIHKTQSHKITKQKNHPPSDKLTKKTVQSATNWRKKQLKVRQIGEKIVRFRLLPINFQFEYWCL